jgi:LL-diaminopimelate aminotransferase
MQIADKLNSFRAYGGPAMNQKIAVMRAAGKDVINLGLGDPDMNPPAHLLRALADAVSKSVNHHYPSAYPVAIFYDAIAHWYKRRHGVEIDPETEVLYCLGAADGIFQLPNCLLNAGDIALVSDPAYPSYEAAIKMARGNVEFYPLLPENNFLPDLDAIPSDVAIKAKMIWVNFPNNPTTATAGKEFYRELIDWAEAYNVVVVSDNPYMDLGLDGYKPPSFLSVPGAKKVGVELNSMSKSFNCCGWRVGMLLGNSEIISAMAKLKSHADRGLYYPLQVATIAALTGAIDWMDERSKTFAERRDVVVGAWKKMGLEMMTPKATFYCWGKISPGYTAEEFCLKLLEEANVWMIPGPTYGERGEGFVRISCVQPTERIAEAMERVGKFMS